MRKLLAISAFFSLLVQPATAMENGESALGSDRIISIHPAGMTGFLYDDRIVFTNAHSVVEKSGSLRPNDFWKVSNPGAKTWSQSTYAQVVQVFIADGYRDWNPRSDWARPNDFAILILDRPVANVERAVLATEEKINSYRDQGALVTTGGYGFQSKVDRDTDYSKSPRIVEPKKATLRMASGDYITTAVAGHIAGRSYDARRGPYPTNLAYHLLSPYGGPGTCDGDSGSGFYREEGSDLVYLGTIGAHLGITNCGNDSPIPGYTPLIGITPVYPYLSLVATAEKWVKENPTLGLVSNRTLNFPVFAGSTAALSSKQKNWLSSRLKSAMGYSKVVCQAFFTSKKDEKLSKKRADSVCREVSRAYGDWQVETRTAKAKSSSQKGLVQLILTE